VKLIRRGEPADDIWKIILSNHRTPRSTWGDLHAMIGSLHLARSAIVPVLFAMFLALLLSPAVNALARLVPRELGAAWCGVARRDGAMALNATAAGAWMARCGAGWCARGQSCAGDANHCPGRVGFRQAGRVTDPAALPRPGDHRASDHRQVGDAEHAGFADRDRDVLIVTYFLWPPVIAAHPVRRHGAAAPTGGCADRDHDQRGPDAISQP
jgi:hypothetical protein